jgi:hypothetical protein
MNIDIRAINTIVLAIASFVGMVIVFALRKRVGFMWLVVAIEVLLFTLLIRRIDTISSWFGLDVISQDVNDFVVSWVVIIALYVSFIRLYQRRNEINQIEALHEAQHEKNQRLLKAHEDTMRMIDEGWTDDRIIIEHTESLNRQIEQALKT